MKKIFVILSVLISVNALADVPCGSVIKIPAEELKGLRDPSCIGLNTTKRGSIAVASGSDEEGNLVIKKFYINRAGETRMIAHLDLSGLQKDSIPYFAFQQSCGIGLITSRIVDDSEVLLIFSDSNIIKWNSFIHTVETLHSNYDPDAIYTCEGYTPSIDADKERIQFDAKNRTLTLLNGDESLLIRF